MDLSGICVGASPEIVVLCCCVCVCVRERDSAGDADLIGKIKIAGC